MLLLSARKIPWGLRKKPSQPSSFSALFLHCGELICRDKMCTHGCRTFTARESGPVFYCDPEPQRFNTLWTVMIWFGLLFVSFLSFFFSFPIFGPIPFFLSCLTQPSQGWNYTSLSPPSCWFYLSQGTPCKELEEDNVWESALSFHAVNSGDCIFIHIPYIPCYRHFWPRL